MSTEEAPSCALLKGYIEMPLMFSVGCDAVDDGFQIGPVGFRLAAAPERMLKIDGLDRKVFPLCVVCRMLQDAWIMFDLSMLSF